MRFLSAIERDPHCKMLADAFDASVKVAVKVLVWRHLFLFVIFTPTVVGVFLLYYGCRHLAQAVLSTSILPEPFSGRQLSASSGHTWQE
jgi:ABC-type arginine/histidine transport system permease subunit